MTWWALGFCLSIFRSLCGRPQTLPVTCMTWFQLRLHAVGARWHVCIPRVEFCKDSSVSTWHYVLLHGFRKLIPSDSFCWKFNAWLTSEDCAGISLTGAKLPRPFLLTLCYAKFSLCIDIARPPITGAQIPFPALALYLNLSQDRVACWRPFWHPAFGVHAAIPLCWILLNGYLRLRE